MPLSDDELKGYEDFARLNMAGAVSTGLIPIPTHHLLALITEVRACRAQLADIVPALEWMSSFDDASMAVALTLHYDMRGKARDLLAKLDKPANRG